MPDFEMIPPGAIGSENPPDWNRYSHRFLAQGDSWFSIGGVPFSTTTNVLQHTGLATRAAVVNCADPGFTLKRMLDRLADPVFQQLLFGANEHAWDGVLVSGLGNDVIDALSAKASAPLEERLLLPAADWGAQTAPSRYISEKGWKRFEAYAHSLYRDLDAMRQRSRHNRTVRIVTHTYDLATPRNAPAGPSGPWLFKALSAYGIPPADWRRLADEVLGRLATLIGDIAKVTPDMHVIETQGTLTPAPEGSTGKVGHWANEIHPSRSGYQLLGKVWSTELQKLYPSGVEGTAAEG
jgi:hypothetical protein